MTHPGDSPLGGVAPRGLLAAGPGPRFAAGHNQRLPEISVVMVARYCRSHGSTYNYSTKPAFRVDILALSTLEC